jgi:DNA topoisomerase-3
MTKKLVLAEKPSVGRDIARVLNCNKKLGKGAIEGNDYIVTWALGHLVTLARPELYDQKYASWDLNALPMMPEKLKLEVIPKTSGQFKLVKKLMYRKDVTEIIIATDAGREGELVARWIIDMANVKKPLKRLWISSVTDGAIKKGFKNLKNGKEYRSLYKAAVARSEADWFVGLNATRALTTKYNAQLSCGRVQTPTLAMIQAREREIIEFKAVKYWEIDAKSSGITFKWQDKKTNSTRCFNKERIEKIYAGIQNKELEIIKLDEKIKKSYAPELYDLTTLQRDANKLHGFSAKETLKIMQTLYERYKALTYPRTDSRYLTDDIVSTLKERLDAVNNNVYREGVQKAKLNGLKGNKHFVDNKKVSDHHAIIPTEQRIEMSRLEFKERKIYEMVVQRFIEVLLPPYEYSEMVIEAEINGELFKAKSTKTLKKGWKIFSQNSDKNCDVENIKEGMKIRVQNLKRSENYTQPPARFDEGKLLAAMENPKKYMETNDKSLLKTIGETGGLGTVATRADIIEKLFNTHLIEKRDQKIYITSKGKQLLELAPKALTSPELTAEWEIKLEQISKNKFDSRKFISEIRAYTSELVKEIKASELSYRHDNMTRQKCPECGKFLLDVSNKHGKALVCQDRECGYKKQLSRVTNARCPECKKKMNMIGEKDNKKFVCPKCGYRESLEHFEKKKNEKKKQMSKKEARNYMKKQQKEEEDFNNPFAALLKNIDVKK